MKQQQHNSVASSTIQSCIINYHPYTEAEYSSILVMKFRCRITEMQKSLMQHIVLPSWLMMRNRWEKSHISTEVTTKFNNNEAKEVLLNMISGSNVIDNSNNIINAVTDSIVVAIITSYNSMLSLALASLLSISNHPSVLFEASLSVWIALYGCASIETSILDILSLWWMQQGSKLNQSELLLQHPNIEINTEHQKYLQSIYSQYFPCNISVSQVRSAVQLITHLPAYCFSTSSNSNGGAANNEILKLASRRKVTVVPTRKFSSNGKRRLFEDDIDCDNSYSTTSVTAGGVSAPPSSSFSSLLKMQQQNSELERIDLEWSK